ncbi:hypothetical protein, partial [Dyella sp.]|uniref:hypothetical protein n=1 Tax=Dyella sp. TaxID=1869338 RepID=UPI002D797097
MQSQAAIDFVRAVDTFMAAQKFLVLGGVAPTWQSARDVDAQRLKLPLEVNGEQSGQYLLLDAFPEHHTLKFCIGIIFLDHVVDRLDYDLEASHANDFSAPLPNLVHGPHWHAWGLNKSSVK